MVRELKDKLVGIEIPGATALPETAGPVFSTLEQDVLSALQNLGLPRSSAEQAVRKVSERGAPESFEAFFRAAMALIR